MHAPTLFAGLAGLARSVVLGVVLLGVLACGAEPPSTDVRPNLLLFFTDQERDPALHLPALARPNLERLAVRGTRFTHAYTVFPSCSPSRATLLTGLYPHQTGVLENVDRSKRGPPLDPELPNLAHVLGASGYRTGYFGKWHLSEWDVAEGYGFETMFPLRRNVGLEGDATTAARAASWIRDHAAAGPWLAVVSIVNPHDVYLAERYPEARLANLDVRLPPNHRDPEAVAESAPELRRWRERQRGTTPRNDKGWLDYVRLYAYLIERTDRQLGVVLDALETSGQRGRTVVVYTSDHGEMAGSHGLRAKRVFYEESVRVPLILSLPDAPEPREIDTPVSLLDVVPTLAALAGVEWPRVLPGRSLLSVEQAGQGEARAIFAESNLDPAHIPTGLDQLALMLRTRRYKYVRYPSGAEQLHDEQADPTELHDLVSDPAHQQALDHHRQTLDTWLATQQFPKRAQK